MVNKNTKNYLFVVWLNFKSYLMLPIVHISTKVA